MEFFTQQGTFWLPRQRDRVVHGSVAVQEDGITLNLTASLRAPIAPAGGVSIGSPAYMTEPVVHGYLRDGSEVTLYQARGVSWPLENLNETWRAAFLFSGGLVTKNRFVQVQVVFDYLMPWVQPPGIATTAKDGHSDVTVDARRVILEQAKLADGTVVRLRAGAEGRWNHASVHLDQWTAFEVTGLARKSKTVLEVLNDWVRPLQDLLVVCLGRPVRIDQLAVRPRGQPAGRALLGVSCQLVQPQLAIPPKAIDVESYTAPTLLTYRSSPVPFSQLIATWFGLREQFPDVITDLCSPYYAPFIYSGHRYSSTFQSAEALAHGLLGTKEKNRPEHRERINAVTEILKTADLDEEIIGWATRVLQGKNDKPLHALIKELITGTGEMGRLLVRAAPRLAEEAASARTRVSHPGRGGPGLARRYWLGEAITWVVRAHVLAQLGIPIQDLSQHAIRMAPFKEVLSALKARETGPRTNLAPAYHHPGCPVNHKSEATAARCRNRA